MKEICFGKYLIDVQENIIEVNFEYLLKQEKNVKPELFGTLSKIKMLIRKCLVKALEFVA